MPEPHLDLLDVLAGGEQERRAGVPEGVEADPRYFCAHRRRAQDVAPQVGAVELLAGQGGEANVPGGPSSARSRAATSGDSGMVRSPASTWVSSDARCAAGGSCATAERRRDRDRCPSAPRWPRRCAGRVREELKEEPAVVGKLVEQAAQLGASERLRRRLSEVTGPSDGRAHAARRIAAHDTLSTAWANSARSTTT
jgi:hypothetical protein